MFADAYTGKRVFVTGHTGFKGSWLCLWLARLGAEVTGYALPPPTDPSLFKDANVAAGLTHVLADIRDRAALREALDKARPHFIFHLAAQPLVLDSYAAPDETFAVNLAGSIELMEAIRHTRTRAAVIMVTTDKVYRNNGTGRPFAEDDPLGGDDPYSASKATMELAVACWRTSFFAAGNSVRMATARAGNVIGGGDWSAHRIVPDLARALIADAAPRLRHPGALRPWQHVLEPLAGYLRLGALLAADGARFAEGWNFGPEPADIQPVRALADAMLARWAINSPRDSSWIDASDPAAPHEADVLRLAIIKARDRLGWRPVWDFAETVARTADWYRQVHAGELTARDACDADISAYCGAAAASGVAFAA